MTHDIACACCVFRLDFLFKTAFYWLATHSILQLFACMLLGPCFTVHFFCVFEQRCHDMFWTLLCMTICLPSSSLETCLLGSVIPKLFISQKTTPASPLTFLHEVASRIRLLHTSFMSSHHCLVHTACAQKFVAAQANSCSISRLLTSKKSETDTDGFCPVALADCLLSTSL